LTLCDLARGALQHIATDSTLNTETHWNGNHAHFGTNWNGKRKNHAQQKTQLERVGTQKGARKSNLQGSNRGNLQ
jgi:hypothetical protein